MFEHGYNSRHNEVVTFLYLRIVSLGLREIRITELCA
jgi:hypothetical protein